MPQVIMNISVDYIAQEINAMTQHELETLTLLLTEEGEELLERKRDLLITALYFSKERKH